MITWALWHLCQMCQKSVYWPIVTDLLVKCLRYNGLAISNHNTASQKEAQRHRKRHLANDGTLRKIG